MIALNKRYIVELLSPEQARSLEPEHLALATCLNSAQGGHLLVYRDNFVAYKIATLTGGQVRLGQIVADDGQEGAGVLALEDGTRLLLEAPVSA